MDPISSNRSPEEETWLTGAKRHNYGAPVSSCLAFCAAFTDWQCSIELVVVRFAFDSFTEDASLSLAGLTINLQSA